MSCLVDDCPNPKMGRGLCWPHLRMYQQMQQADPHTTLRKFLDRVNPDEPLVCICLDPRPDAIGMCRQCGRKVVTFATANRDVYRARWPEEWTRAEQLSLFPGIAPDVIVAQR